MTKLCKIPTVRAFVQEGQLQPYVWGETIARSMQAFYVDMLDKSSEGYQERPWEKWISPAEGNPIRFLDRSSPFSEFEQNNKNLRLQ